MNGITYLRIAIALAVVVLVLWIIGLTCGLHWHVLGVASAAAGLLAAAACGALWWFVKRAEHDPAAAGTAAIRAAVKALHQRWHAELPALRTVQSGGSALITSPWYLVIGAPGCGKTRLLQDSGQAFISANARPAGREPAPTTTFDWWCTADGAWLDTAGRLVTDPRAQDEWRHLLRLIRQARSAPALHGVVLCIDLGGLLTRSRQQATEAGVLRERLDELAAVLGSAPPLYVVFTKSDHLGGFKEFAAALRSSEKDHVLGATIPWPPPADAAEAWRDEHARLAQALRNRRLPSLAQAASEDVVRKLFQFPLQFQAAGRFVQELLHALCRPGLNATAPLRGVYFTSCFTTQRLDSAATAAPKEIAATAQSVFLKSSPSGIATGTSVQEALQTRQGWFIRQLLTAVLPADRDLARPTIRSRIAARQVRWACLVVAPAAAAAVAMLWIAIAGWRQTSLLAEAREPADAVRELAHNAPADVPRNLDALDRLGDRLAALLHSDNRRLGPAIDGASALYIKRLRGLLLDACTARVVDDLRKLRTAPEAAVAKGAQQDALYDLFRCYQMLCGAITVDGALLDRTLLDGRRWFAGLDAAGKSDYHTELLAKRQLALLPQILASGRGRISADRRLVDAITTDLGESLWLRRGYDDLLRSVQDQFPAARAELLASDQATLETTHSFTLVYSQRGWDEAVRRGIDEKADALARTFQELDIVLPRAEITRRLTELYAEDYRRQWLQLIATPRAAVVHDLRDVPELITRLTATGTPYPDFIKAALGQLDLRTGTLQVFAAHEDLTWIEPALRAIGELRKEVEAFIATTKPGERAKDPLPVQALADRFNAIAVRISETVAVIQPEDKRNAVRRGLESIVHSLWLPLDRELAEELDRRWASQVAPAWISSCAGRFPFIATAVEEVPLPVFARFFNPVSGVFWSVAGPIERFRTILVVGHPAVTLDPAYAAAVNQVSELRERCFAGSSETVNAPFTVTLIQREGVEDVTFGIGSQRNSLYERPDARFALALRQSEPPTVQISIRISKGQWRPREVPNQAWGLLRLLRAGDPQVQRQGGYLLTWPVETAIDGRPTVFKACLVLEPTGFERAAFGDLFSACVIPPAILPAPPLAVKAP